MHFLQNHDQIANSARGLRISKLTSPARLRALTALLLLGPQTPMLFQGQEFGSSNRFLYFLDSREDMAGIVQEGRESFLSQIPGIQDASARTKLAVPHDPATFAACKLDWTDFEKNADVVALHRDLLRLRRSEPAILRAAGERTLDASVVGPAAFLIRFFGGDGRDDRLLLVNLGPDLPIDSLPDPLFAAPSGHDWELAWSSDDPDYGGGGRRPVDLKDRWVLSADAALFFRTCPATSVPEMSQEDMAAWQRNISRLG